MSGNRYRNRNPLYIRIGRGPEIPIKRVYIETLIVIAFAIVADLASTYFLFRDFPQEAVYGEQNKLVVASYEKYGLEGVPRAFTRFWSGWIGVGCLGSFLIYFAVIKYLDVKPIHRIGLSLCLGLSMATLMNFGAGLNNTVLYLMLKFGW